MKLHNVVVLLMLHSFLSFGLVVAVEQGLPLVISSPELSVLAAFADQDHPVSPLKGFQAKYPVNPADHPVSPLKQCNSDHPVSPVKRN